MSRDHMDCIQDVVIDDLHNIRIKEATYRGSWKRRGGIGAFMMLARKWDRLENMLSPQGAGSERAPWDVFDAVALAPDGEDGTPLAELRDLRRYLILVEAEMRAQGYVVPRRPGTTAEATRASEHD